MNTGTFASPAAATRTADAPSIFLEKIQGRLPVLLSIMFAGSVSLLVWRNLDSWNGVIGISGLCVVIFYITWLLVESRVAVGETRMQRTRQDRGTLELYALARGLTVLTGLAFPSVWTGPGPWLLIGPGLLVAGVLFRLNAIHTLGQFYSHRVRLQDDHQVISRGPYRFVRHPAYTGMLLAHVGFVVCFCNLASLASFLALFVPAVVARIHVEEETLSALPGYAQYSAGRRRLVPWVW